VVETVESGGYTYVQVDTGDKRVWAAAPKFRVAVGDTVTVPAGMPMAGYHSKTLNRTFDLVYFVPYVSVKGAEGSAGALSSAHAPVEVVEEPVQVDFAGIEKPPGGKNVSELFKEKTGLKGKEVLVRGKVVKFTAGIMGKNWIHLQDGTGEKGTNDLTITTDSDAQVGDIVLIRGTVSTDKDFGFGYRYELIIEDARVTVE
jgi:hypothetical protein